MYGEGEMTTKRLQLAAATVIVFVIALAAFGGASWTS
jgi:hypothetical protein